MLFKPFAAAGLILAVLAGAASAETMPGFPQVSIFAPNARVVLLPGAFLPLSLNNGPTSEISSNEHNAAGIPPAPQNTAGAQPTLPTPGASHGPDITSALAKIAQDSQSLLNQIGGQSSISSHQTDSEVTVFFGSQPGISTVPLPAGLPLFAAALIATAALGWGRRLRSART